MSPVAKTHDAHPWGDLDAALRRFGAEALQSLDATTRAAHRALDRLAARRRYWQTQVHRYQERVSGLQDTLLAPRVITYYDPQTGLAYVPKPRVYETALAESQSRLGAAQTALRDVEEWDQIVQQATADYQREALRLTALLQAGLPSAEGLTLASAHPAPGIGSALARVLGWRSAGSRFDDAWTTLKRRWMEACEQCHDPVQWRFEAELWPTLEQQVDTTRRERIRLAQIVNQAQHGVQ